MAMDLLYQKLLKYFQIIFLTSLFIKATYSKPERAPFLDSILTKSDEPLCAWRFLSDGLSWNVAWPDTNSIYHVMALYSAPGIEFRLSSNSLPYARYFSFQTYDGTSLSLSSITDYKAKVVNGINAYNNLENAINGDVQGNYTIYVTEHGWKGYDNELQALKPWDTEGVFFLVMRIYVPDDTPPSQFDLNASCYSNKMTSSQFDYQKAWGWACPPTLEVRNITYSDEWERIDDCKYERNFPFSRINDTAVPSGLCLAGINEDNNFFLGNSRSMQGLFNNFDANYLLSCGEINPDGKTDLWARLTSVLPRTSNSLYSQPYVSNFSDYEVRYISISTINRSKPKRVYESIKDIEIEEYYSEKFGNDWNRTFVIWVGPENSPTPQQAIDESAIIMRWPLSLSSNESAPFVGLVYRQILTESQFLNSSESVTYHGVGDVIPLECDQTTVSNHTVCQPDKCCGFWSHECCHLPTYVESVLGNSYPNITFIEI